VTATRGATFPLMTHFGAAATGARTAWRAFCDREQRLCFALAFWNGRDSILKGRVFGLSGPEGNHGEDAKEYWWYLDATRPPHGSAGGITIRRLNSLCASTGGKRAPHARRSGIRASRHRHFRRRSVLADDDGLRQRGGGRHPNPHHRVTRGLEPAELRILPTFWFCNPWFWEDSVGKPVIRDASFGTNALAIAEEEHLGAWRLIAKPDPTGCPSTLLFCENETNVPKLFGGAASTPYHKDGINDRVINVRGNRQSRTAA
jgi:hypothetical protein